MDRDIAGQPTADYLWTVKQVVPFLKVDEGLAAEKDEVQLMKPMPGLAARLDKARRRGYLRHQDAFGHQAGQCCRHQERRAPAVEVAGQISARFGLVPIIEPEVDIHCPDKARAEVVLKAALLRRLNDLPASQLVMLKLTLPEHDDFYAVCVSHPNVVRVVALSGGYTRDRANNRLRRNHGVVASFSRALVEGLTAQQSDAEFNARLGAYVQVSLRRPTRDASQALSAWASRTCTTPVRPRAEDHTADGGATHMRIGIATDHGGFGLKEELLAHLRDAG